MDFHVRLSRFFIFFWFIIFKIGFRRKIEEGSRYLLNFFPSGKCFPFSRLPFSCELFLISPEPTFGFARQYLAKLIWKRKILNSSRGGEFCEENIRRRHHLWKMRFPRGYHFSSEHSTEIFITQSYHTHACHSGKRDYRRTDNRETSVFDIGGKVA